jgi:Bacterial protein of unknown function (DUF839)
VEVDPFDPESTPRKHTWLGRLRHENAAVTLSKSGNVVVYTGHDQEDQRIYKFVSSGTFDPDDREANFDLLTDGMLYVTNFSQGRWIPLDYDNNPVFGDNGFASQADVLVRAPEASALPLQRVAMRLARSACSWGWCTRRGTRLRRRRLLKKHPCPRESARSNITAKRCRRRRRRPHRDAARPL